MAVPLANVSKIKLQYFFHSVNFYPPPQWNFTTQHTNSTRANVQRTVNEFCENECRNETQFRIFLQSPLEELTAAAVSLCCVATSLQFIIIFIICGPRNSPAAAIHIYTTIEL